MMDQIMQPSQSGFPGVYRALRAYPTYNNGGSSRQVLPIGPDTNRAHDNPHSVTPISWALMT